MKLLVTGVTGQVGFELARSLQPLGEVVAVDRHMADLSRPETLAGLIDRVRPDVIVNPAAYTAVDKAEDEEALAMSINGAAPGALAVAARRHNALLVHYSTDYVFDGGKTAPYLPEDTPAPLGAYGRSKLAGERAIAEAGGDWLVLRTSWVYGARGKNFMRTMLRLAGEREELRVVADQIGAPTTARLIADSTAQIVHAAMRQRQSGQFESGIHHLVAAGETSWHGFAEAIVAGARERRPDSVRVRRVVPIGTAEYPTPARRPANSRLSTASLEQHFGVVVPPWQQGLALALDETFD
ncbi:dTDP-4-dehydrorhamnose reductase [Uliginosibacterium sp. sgz301328]|uniref:dTDP-4-dehydrorhamnose reductase n=1 Tax=Uliginosibacterium sp. sgz301328 TaxID=3243764 RepID=UPI00359CCEDF